ncbi:MAG TPA: protocatechuate 3,4-dioxygenase subunit beta [Solirubrobacteraceae bacterium]|jgi:protocatechuate 3,4-dioxygenase beta subunit
MAVAEIEDFNPPYLHPAYVATLRRAPSKRLIEVPHDWFHHARGPVWGRVPVRPGDNDLTKQHAGRPIGQTITLSGRVLDSDGRGVPNTLLEIWQTNASGAYVDPADPGFMSLDPNFTGAGRTITDSDGGYHFRTIKPAAYPGDLGALFRPAHIHTSLFGPLLSHRLVTQCYFEGDPLQDRDPILQSIPDQRGVERLLARFNSAETEVGDIDSALAYDWDIVLRGPRATPMENDH